MNASCGIVALNIVEKKAENGQTERKDSCDKGISARWIYLCYTHEDENKAQHTCRKMREGRSELDV